MAIEVGDEFYYNGSACDYIYKVEEINRDKVRPHECYKVMIQKYPGAPSGMWTSAEWIDEHLVRVWNPIVYDYNKSDKRIEFKNGSILWFGSLEDPEMAEGPNVDAIHVDEMRLIRNLELAIQTMERRLRGIRRAAYPVRERGGVKVRRRYHLLNKIANLWIAGDTFLYCYGEQRPDSIERQRLSLIFEIIFAPLFYIVWRLEGESNKDHALECRKGSICGAK